jgi:4-alpha-glucanotransferase
MRHAGGLRIDHVVGMQQLYWIPQGSNPAAGAYVEYPIDDLIGILALESQRHQCLVVGEDLGTVPEGFRDRLSKANILSYRVLFFEQGDKGVFRTSEEYPFLALSVVGSHDLPTFRGWWQGRDVQLKQRLGLYPSETEFTHQQSTRERDKAELLEMLCREGLILSDVEPSVETLVTAVHKFLSLTSSALAMVQIDDVTGEVEQVNVPATSDENPNWRRRLALTMKEISSDQHTTGLLRILSNERPRSTPK